MTQVRITPTATLSPVPAVAYALRAQMTSRTLRSHVKARVAFARDLQAAAFMFSATFAAGACALAAHAAGLL